MTRAHLAIVLASALASSACRSVDLDVTDHDATFVTARVRKELSSDDVHTRTFAELSVDSVEGTESSLDYRIRALELGAGMEKDLGPQFWVGISGGLALHQAELDTTPADLDDDSDLGVYIALEGGFRAASWLELYARADSTLYMGNFTLRDRFELGVRVPIADHVALFTAWRTAQYEFDEVDSGFVFDSIDLEANGVVFGLLVDF